MYVKLKIVIYEMSMHVLLLLLYSDKINYCETKTFWFCPLLDKAKSPQTRCKHTRLLLTVNHWPLEPLSKCSLHGCSYNEEPFTVHAIVYGWWEICTNRLSWQFSPNKADQKRRMGPHFWAPHSFTKHYVSNSQPENVCVKKGEKHCRQNSKS